MNSLKVRKRRLAVLRSSVKFSKVGGIMSAINDVTCAAFAIGMDSTGLPLLSDIKSEDIDKYVVSLLTRRFGYDLIKFRSAEVRFRTTRTPFGLEYFPPVIV